MYLCTIPPLGSNYWALVEMERITESSPVLLWLEIPIMSCNQNSRSGSVQQQHIITWKWYLQDDIHSQSKEMTYFHTWVTKSASIMFLLQHQMGALPSLNWHLEESYSRGLHWMLNSGSLMDQSGRSHPASIGQQSLFPLTCQTIWHLWHKKMCPMG